jgi:hypothetical protein
MTAVTGEQPRMSEAEREIFTRQGRDADRQALFDRIRALYDADLTIRDIAQELGLGLRRVQRWVRLIELPARNVMAPKPSTPAYYGAYLARRWAEGVTTVKGLLMEINRRGYTGSHSHLAGFTPCEVSSENCARISTRFGTPSLNLGAMDKSRARSIG